MTGGASERRLGVVVASGNPAKVAVIAGLLAGLGGVRVMAPPTDHDISHKVVGGAATEAEGGAGASFAANARAKALAVSARVPGAVVVATDGGLLMPGLGERWDPVRTRRFAGAAVTDGERAAVLLALAAGLRGEQRAIGWREAMVVVRDGELLATWEVDDRPGVLAENVDRAAVGGGFWVPAVWRCPEFEGRRLADLTPDERAARGDHWARLGERLRELVGREAGRETVGGGVGASILG